MTDLIRSESIKLTTIRAPKALLAAVAGLSALGLLLALFVDGPFAVDALTQAGTQRSLLSITPVTTFALILGALIGTGDHRHGTITSTLLATPRRERVLAAKAVVTVAAALVLGVVSAAVLALVGSASILAQGGEIVVGAGDVAGLWAGGAVALVGSALVGLGVGEAVRSQVAAIVGLLIAVVIVFPLVAAFLPDVAWFLPSGLDTVLAEAPPDAPFGAPIAGLLYGAYAAAALGAGAAVLSRRDVT